MGVEIGLFLALLTAVGDDGRCPQPESVAVVDLVAAWAEIAVIAADARVAHDDIFRSRPSPDDFIRNSREWWDAEERATVAALRVARRSRGGWRSAVALKEDALARLTHLVSELPVGSDAAVAVAGPAAQLARDIEDLRFFLGLLASDDDDAADVAAVRQFKVHDRGRRRDLPLLDALTCDDSAFRDDLWCPFAPRLVGYAMGEPAKAKPRPTPAWRDPCVEALFDDDKVPPSEWSSVVRDLGLQDVVRLARLAPHAVADGAEVAAFEFWQSPGLRFDDENGGTLRELFLRRRDLFLTSGTNRDGMPRWYHRTKAEELTPDERAAWVRTFLATHEQNRR